MFDRLKPDGEQAWAVVIQPQYMLVVCGEYDRWHRFRDRTLDYFRKLFPRVDRHATVVALQYTDEFVVSGDDVQDLSFAEMFSSTTRFLPTNCHRLTDLWHSHHGYFERIEGLSPHRRLSNVNVNVIDQAPNRIVQIVTSHRAILHSAQPDVQALLGPAGTLLSLIEDMHVLNKDILKDLLNEERKRQINLS